LLDELLEAALQADPSKEATDSVETFLLLEEVSAPANTSGAGAGAQFTQAPDQGLIFYALRHDEGVVGGTEESCTED
jgi:hypothetical protein